MYSKNGSIPKPQTDGTEGWIEVEDPPVAGDGEEVVWWYPPGWVVRPVKPADEEGIEWNWSQSEQKWVSGIMHTDAILLGADSFVFAENSNGSSAPHVAWTSSEDISVIVDSNLSWVEGMQS